MYVNIITYSNKLLLFVWSMIKKKKKKDVFKTSQIERLRDDVNQTSSGRLKSDVFKTS